MGPVRAQRTSRTASRSNTAQATATALSAASTHIVTQRRGVPSSRDIRVSASVRRTLSAPTASAASAVRWTTATRSKAITAATSSAPQRGIHRVPACAAAGRARRSVAAPQSSAPTYKLIATTAASVTTFAGTKPPALRANAGLPRRERYCRHGGLGWLPRLMCLGSVEQDMPTVESEAVSGPRRRR
jgi:hypothetical protein